MSLIEDLFIFSFSLYISSSVVMKDSQINTNISFTIKFDLATQNNMFLKLEIFKLSLLNEKNSGRYEMKLYEHTHWYSLTIFLQKMIDLTDS